MYPTTSDTAYLGGIDRHQVAFQNPALLLLGQTAQHLSQMLP
jgi:hypothetical protein